MGKRKSDKHEGALVAARLLLAADAADDYGMANKYGETKAARVYAHQAALLRSIAAEANMYYTHVSGIMTAAVELADTILDDE